MPRHEGDLAARGQAAEELLDDDVIDYSGSRARTTEHSGTRGSGTVGAGGQSWRHGGAVRERSGASGSDRAGGMEERRGSVAAPVARAKQAARGRSWRCGGAAWEHGGTSGSGEACGAGQSGWHRGATRGWPADKEVQGWSGRAGGAGAASGGGGAGAERQSGGRGGAARERPAEEEARGRAVRGG
uniref:Uncharacterized protein n=1 Tax=Setaria viridis TaxID=4556 RepID=A0A4V6D3P1_SETVI|nr:hypothetical protein SEVIR_7G019100v2 [Setaria viridis]